MEELFYALLQDVYFAEKQLVKTLPKLAKNSANEKLQEAFINHYDETEEQVARLEKVFEAIGKRARGKTSDAILGIVAEGQKVIDEVDDEVLRDAGIIAAAQAAEHYEIALRAAQREGRRGLMASTYILPSRARIKTTTRTVPSTPPGAYPQLALVGPGRQRANE